MEDDKLKDLFQGFQPELQSDMRFMAKLQKSIDAVEIVKQHNAREHRRSRIAVVVAAISGFVAGVILTLLFPAISQWLSSITISLPRIGIAGLNFDAQIASWLVIGGICVTVAVNAYELTLSRLSLKESVA